MFRERRDKHKPNCQTLSLGKGVLKRILGSRITVKRPASVLPGEKKFTGVEVARWRFCTFQKKVEKPVRKRKGGKKSTSLSQSPLKVEFRKKSMESFTYMGPAAVWGEGRAVRARNLF